jgi:hypothetical protein
MPAAQPDTPWTDPTHSAAARPRKPRRLGLYVPWAVAAVLVVGWSLAWLWLMGETERRLDAGAAGLRAAGWRVAWAGRHLGGYPFRLDVDLTGLSIADPSGWGVAAPSLKSEAYAFAADHWVFFLPGGVVVARPRDGAIDVTARVLRGSVAFQDRSPPRIALEGDDVAFTPAPGASPLWVSAARNLQAYTRPGPDDQVAAYLQIAGGTAAPANWLAKLGHGGPVSLKTDVIFSHVSAFKGPTWRAALTAWAHGGGAVDVGHVALGAGSQSFTSQSGAFAVGDDGRLVGQLGLSGGAFGDGVTLQLENGGAWLGPLQVAPTFALF